MLKFTRGNAKLVRGELILDLPAGHSCPFARQCFSKANRQTGKLIDGKEMKFRCYAASVEIFPNVRRLRWHNFTLLRQAGTFQKIFELLMKSLPYGSLVRFHTSGDFFSQNYFDAVLKLSQVCKDRIIYAYTKALPFWVKRLDEIPDNFRLNASFGGTHDHLIKTHDLKSVQVVSSVQLARKKGLEIDHDDTRAWAQNKSFALLLHGNGPAGTLQANMYYHTTKVNR